MLHALALATQVAVVPMQASADDRPVRLWLGPSPVARGEAVPVYVSVATEGYLLVLRAATDGHVEIVFPADPTSDGAIRPGAYVLRGVNNRPALVASEPNGTGLVLAALSPRPFRSGEFLRPGGRAWSRDALIAAWPGADGVGTLTDIVQRMLGDGWFTYGLAIYTVGPRRQRVAPPAAIATEPAPTAPGIGVCSGCIVVYQTVAPPPVVEQTIVQQTIVEPVVLLPTVCDPFVGACHRRHRRPERPRFRTEGICQAGVDCPPGTGTPAKAVLVPQRASLVMSPIGRRAPEPIPQPPPEVSVPVYRIVTRDPGPVPMNPGLAPGVRTVTSRFVFSGNRSGGTMPAAPPAPASQSRTIALPRALFRK